MLFLRHLCSHAILIKEIDPLIRRNTTQHSHEIMTSELLSFETTEYSVKNHVTCAPQPVSVKVQGRGKERETFLGSRLQYSHHILMKETAPLSNTYIQGIHSLTVRS